MTLRCWLDPLKKLLVTARAPAPYALPDAPPQEPPPMSTTGNWLEASRHPSGYVRENAVKALSERPNGEALVALVERLNDWVPQVRDAAKAGVQTYLKREHLASLLFAQGPLMALATRQRVDHSATLAAVRALLQAPEARDEVHASFLTQQGKAACYLFGVLLESASEPYALLHEALVHREPLVRLAAVDACAALATAQAHQLLLGALPKASAKLRVRLLRVVLPVVPAPQGLLQDALLHSSGGVRNLALWACARYAVDAPAVLAQRFAGPPPVAKAHWLGVLGLARDLKMEVPGGWWHAAMHAAPWSVRLAAVQSPGERPLAALLEAVDDPSERVFDALVSRLNVLPWVTLDPAVRTLLDRQWHVLAPPRRQRVLALLAGWQQLGYLLERLASEPTQRARWLDTLSAWCERAYGFRDAVTPQAQRSAIKAQLQDLVRQGALDEARVAHLY
ncbi:PBS lyase [Pseudomonas sp. UBA6562]|uniref:PBS lyase n=1 Tax=Pseudomonas sp. UBA6562 TaxID=1947332 RepID=UPI0025DF57E7|nr:PBS lyase [Pseudomonas sp. UBA6562]